jgi:AcrR family transcriptional regulator
MARAADTTGGPRRLPRGRHDLSREQVEADQRLRILLALAETMSAKGYVRTPVADVIGAAGVSRETFYRLFDDKLDAFLAAFDLAAELLVGTLTATLEAHGSPIERVERAVAAYLDAIALEPAYARLFLVEVDAAGPVAIARRHEVQRAIADGLAEALGARSPSSRFACQVVVASVSSLVVVPLVEGDSDAIRALGPPLVEHLRRLDDSGIVRG